MLTGKQSRLLRFIESRLSEGDVSPSFEEMRLHLGLRSKSGVHRLLEALCERGLVVRLAHRARSLRVVRGGSEGLGASFRSGGGGEVRLPFLGNVAAGLPVDAVGVAGWNEAREYPSDLLGGYGGSRSRERAGEEGLSKSDVRMIPHYALRVEGDSMVEAGILDGDTVIVEACDDARDGELVIALVDEGEATLKILRREGEEILLEAANKAYEVQRYTAGRVRVQGRVTGLMRKYARR